MEQTLLKVLVNFRRLLSKCERMVEREAEEERQQQHEPLDTVVHTAQTAGQEFIAGRPESSEDRYTRQFRFKTYVHCLRQMIDQLMEYSCKQPSTSQSQINGALTPSILHDYLRRVQRLQDLVDEDKLLAPADRGQKYLIRTADALRYRNSRKDQMPAIARSTKEHQINLRLTQRAREQQRQELLYTALLPLAAHGDSTIDGIAIGDHNDAKISSGRGASNLMNNDLLLHDQFSTEMARMAEQLKQNSLAFNQLLHKDQQILDETLGVMENNQGRLRREMSRLRVFSDKYGNTCLMQLCLTVLVIIVFLLMFMFIRLVPKKVTAPAMFLNENQHQPPKASLTISQTPQKVYTTTTASSVTALNNNEL